MFADWRGESFEEIGRGLAGVEVAGEVGGGLGLAEGRALGADQVLAVPALRTHLVGGHGLAHSVHHGVLDQDSVLLLEQTRLADGGGTSQGTQREDLGD